jgi:hypothetical protein
MEYEIRSEGLTDFDIRFRAVREFREEIVDTIERAADEAGAYMGTHVPFHTGQLFRAINVGPVEYSPGAAGGGGFYEVHVGVDESLAPHAEFVVEGTGIFNRERPTNGIFPAQGNVMTFSKQGEGQIFTRWTRGQEPQRAWFENAMELARTIIARKIAGI